MQSWWINNDTQFMPHQHYDHAAEQALGTVVQEAGCNSLLYQCGPARAQECDPKQSAGCVPLSGLQQGCGRFDVWHMHGINSLVHSDSSSMLQLHPLSSAPPATAPPVTLAVAADVVQHQCLHSRCQPHSRLARQSCSAAGSTCWGHARQLPFIPRDVHLLRLAQERAGEGRAAAAATSSSQPSPATPAVAMCSSVPQLLQHLLRLSPGKYLVQLQLGCSSLPCYKMMEQAQHSGGVIQPCKPELVSPNPPECAGVACEGQLYDLHAACDAKPLVTDGIVQHAVQTAQQLAPHTATCRQQLL